MVIRLQDIGRAVRETEYAVRGPIVARANELERQGREIIYCNIGNPQALKQRPLTWIRQVVALAEYPELMASMPNGTFPADVVDVASMIVRESRFGMGAYTDSKGMAFIRKAIAEFIRERDGIAADPEMIYLTDGASKGVQTILRILISEPSDGILIPIPQYPLYSATITLFGGTQINYHLEEKSDWSLSRGMLEHAYERAREEGIRARAIVVINPGNPTGSVLDEKNIELVLEFAQEHNLAILADEVYQDNVYRQQDRFVSFARVMERRNIKDVSLFSFHSTSKGYMGECGHRGGYFECRNVPADVIAEITKLQSVALCSNSVGQVVTYLMVRPPKPGDPSYAQYEKERSGILDALAHKAHMVEEGLNSIPGVRCNAVAGAMYAFPQITLPPDVTDNDYCLALLEETGICVVPGSGFGQEPGTWHFRTTILPPVDKIEAVVKKLGEFHVRYVATVRRP